MTETSSSEGINPQGSGFTDKQITEARGRIAPILIRKLVERSNRPDNPDQLPPEKIQEKCFSLLGYMEEYYQVPGLDTPDHRANDNTDAEHKRSPLRILEDELDGLLDSDTQEKTTRRQLLAPRVTEIADEDVPHASALSETEKTEAKLEILNRKEHQSEIEEQLQELLAYPQVRERFVAEFETELDNYRAARRPMREVRDIKRVTNKLKRAIYRTYLENKQPGGKIAQSVGDKIKRFQEKLDELESREKNIESTASAPTFGYLQTQTLLEYKRQLTEEGFVLTPSREALLDKIRQGVLSGKKIFLVGSTGTGKSELAFYTFDELTGGYELIPWHEGSTPRDVHGYPKLTTDPETGQTISTIEPGPYPRAKENEHGLIHAEVTGAPTRVLLELKDTLFKDDRVMQIFAGNPKDARTTQREELDPAIARELTGIEVSYMPANEMADIIRAKLIEKSGIVKLSITETEYIENLTKAAEIMQMIHNRNFADFPDALKGILGIDSHNNTETTLNKNFLDPGTLFKLFDEWELARARGQTFANYMKEKLHDFIEDPKTLNAPEEKETLQKVLQTFGCITTEGNVTIDPQEKGYILPSEMAGQATQSHENPMVATTHSTEAMNVTKERELVERESESWSNFLGYEIPIRKPPQELLNFLQRKESEGGANLEAHFWPGDYVEFTKDVQYPGWQQKPNNLYWEAHPSNLNTEAQWIVIDTTPKPDFTGTQMYEDDPLQIGDIIQSFRATGTIQNQTADPKSRFNISFSEIRSHILPAFATRENLDPENISLPPALIFNILGQMHYLEWGETSTEEWLADDIDTSGKLIGGYSSYGGIAAFERRGVTENDENLGFRVLIAFPPEK